MSVYAIITLGCVVEAVAWRPRAPRTVGWKLLRGLAFAGLVPLLALGAVASFLAQRAIEEQVREDTVRTAAVEADFLRRYVEDARESLRMLLDSPGFRGALADGDPYRLEPYLYNLTARQRPFDAVLAVGAEGAVRASFASVEGLGPLPPLLEAAPAALHRLGPASPGGHGPPLRGGWPAPGHAGGPAVAGATVRGLHSRRAPLPGTGGGSARTAGDPRHRPSTPPLSPACCRRPYGRQC